MSRQFKVGIIGTGAIAKVAYFPVLSAMKNVEMSAVLSGHFENAQNACREFGIKKAFDNLDVFLMQDLDAAILLTPKTVRKQFLVPLMERRIDILCEKPLAMTLKECDYLASESEKNGKNVMIAFNRRFAPANVGAISAFVEARPDLVIANKSREHREFRGTLENAIHMVDLMRHILGECDYVQARAKFEDKFSEDYCAALLGFENNATGMLCASREAGQWREQIELFGAGITAVSDNLDSYKIIYPDKEIGQSFTPLNKGWCSVTKRLGFEQCIHHFFECCETRKEPITSAKDAFKTHELMHRILRSAGLPDLSKEYAYD